MVLTFADSSGSLLESERVTDWRSAVFACRRKRNVAEPVASSCTLKTEQSDKKDKQSNREIKVSKG